MTSYVARDPAAAVRQMGTSLIGAVVLAGIVGVVQDRWGLAALMIVLTVVFTATSARRAYTPLSVDSAGIATYAGTSRSRTRRAESPWNTIHRVEVLPATNSIRVVLRSEASLPWWVTSRIVDPAEPDIGGSWEKQVPDLDPVAFELAVRSNAPEIEVRTR